MSRVDLTVSRLVRIVALATPLLFSGTAAQAQGYPLVCRSGGAMQLSWSALATARTHFIAYYSRAPHAAGTSTPLQSGQCAWVDRPLNSDEPRAMLWDLNATAAIRFTGYGPSTPVTAVTGEPDMTRAKLFVDYLRTSGHYFTATVYNSNAGYMVVTDFRGGR